MKKKGLLISTIVMVVVLIASLTTSTYAWFEASKITTIEKIEFSVKSGSDVSIGLSTTNSYQEGASAGAFVNGSTTIGAAYATTDEGVSDPTAVLQAGDDYWGGSTGLGSRIDMQLDLVGMEKAVGTGKVGSTADSTFAYTALRKVATSSDTGMIISEGNGPVASVGGAEAAYGQKDYLDVVIGVQAAASDLYSIICNVTINPTSGIDLGMNAAIHVAWAIDGMINDSSWNSSNTADIYGENHYNTTLNTLAYTLVGDKTNTDDFGGNGQTLNKGAANKAITVAKSATQTGTDYLDRSTIYQIHLLIWIDGNDSDCNDNALGVGSEILINFSTTHATRVESSK